MTTVPATGRPLPRPPGRRHAGLIRRLMSDPRPVLDELHRDHGPVVGLGAGPMRLAVVGDPDAIQQVFARGTEPFRWGHRYNVLAFVVGGSSLIVSDGTDWTRRRSAVRRGFSRRRLNGWIDTIVGRTDHMIDSILDGVGAGPGVVDLYQEGRELVQAIVVRSMFGAHLGDRSAEIADLFRSAQNYLESPFYRQLPHPLPIGRRHQVRTDLTALRAIVDQRIDQLRSEPAHDPLDVLGALVVEGELDDDEIRDQVITLMGAGMDTTSATLAWMVWCTTLSPGLWHRLRVEADEVLGEEGPFDPTHLARLDLADRVMRETTRLHPAGSFSPRMAHQDLDAAGYSIPKGTLVLWSAHLAGRDPTAWDRPHDFDPDRFLNMSPERAALADAAWAPFGGGTRNCIGFALAQMELTLILARLAQRLDVEAVEATEPRAVGMVVNRPEGGARMQVSCRRPA